MSNWLPQDPLSAASDRSLMPSFRNDMDLLRSQWGAQVAYPDGYLSNVESARRNRLMTGGRSLVNIRSYERGVHRGDRIDPSDYTWPVEFNPMTSIELERRGKKFAPIGKPETAYGDHRMAGTTVPDPDRQRQLANLLPNWK